MNLKPILFAATAKPDASRKFYQESLGLRFISDQPFAIVFDVNGVGLRVQKVEQVAAVPYTSLGFAGEDLPQAVSELSAKGVVFEKYPFLEQDDQGIWSTADGAKVAWCKDPDGNTVSFSQNPK